MPFPVWWRVTDALRASTAGPASRCGGRGGLRAGVAARGPRTAPRSRPRHPRRGTPTTRTPTCGARRRSWPGSCSRRRRPPPRSCTSGWCGCARALVAAAAEESLSGPCRQPSTATRALLSRPPSSPPSGPTSPRARAELAPDARATLALDADRPAAARCPASTSRAPRHRRIQALADDPETPLFFGRLDFDPTTRPGARRRRPLLRRPPARARRRRRPAGHRLARRRVPRVLPGHRAPSRWTSCCAAGSASSAATTHRVRGRAPARPRARATPRRAASSPARSSARASARCATSSRPSSPSRTTSCAPTSTRPSACRARPAPARPPSACTGRRTCSTPTATGCAAAACSSSGRTARSSSYIAAVLPALGEVDVRQVDRRRPGRAACRVRGADTRRGRDAQGRRADGRRCCATRVYARRRPRRPRPLVRAARLAPLAGARLRARGDSWPSCAARTSATAPARAMLAAAAGAPVLTRWRPRASRPTTGCRTRSRAAAPVQGDGRRGLAGGRPGAAGAPAALRPRTSWPPPPTAC